MIIEYIEDEKLLKMSYTHPVNIVETSCLIRVRNMNELMRFMHMGEWEGEQTNYRTYDVSEHPGAIEMFQQIAADHLVKASAPEVKMDAKFKSNVPGTSCLIWKANKGEIAIAYRHSDMSSLNSLCIDDDTREYFFADTKLSGSYRKNGRYILTSEYDAYDDWCKYIEKEYRRQYLNAKRA